MPAMVTIAGLESPGGAWHAGADVRAGRGAGGDGRYHISALRQGHFLRRRDYRRAMRCGRRSRRPSCHYADPQTAPGRAIEALGTNQQRAFRSQVEVEFLGISFSRKLTSRQLTSGVIDSWTDF